MTDNSPSPEALREASILHQLAYRADKHITVNDIARALDDFARQAVERDRLQRAAELHRLLGDPRIGVHVPPADWGLPQNLPDAPSHTKGKP